MCITTYIKISILLSPSAYNIVWGDKRGTKIFDAERVVISKGVGETYYVRGANPINWLDIAIVLIE